MSIIRSIAMGLFCLATAIGHAETQFPYEITVGPAGLDARCGPGTPFYVTDRLPAGAKIEVYRRDEGGWLAIRPPATACSWVRKSDLRPTRQAGVAEVVRDDSISCIGSNRVEVRDHLSYISLHRGELVQLLEAKDHRPPASLGSEWQAIAPPAGEFRWVFIADLKNSGELPESERPIRIPPPERVVESRPSEIATMQTLNVPIDAAVGENAPEAQEAWQIRENSPEPIRVPGDRLSSQVAAAASPAPPSGPIAQGTVGTSSDAVPAGGPLPVQPLPVLSAAAAEESPAANTADTGTAPLLNSGPQWASRRQPLPGDLSQLESELALMVARPLSVWRLESLRERTAAIVDKLPSGVEKVHAEGLLERIASFEQLQNRYIETGAPALTSGAAGAGGAPGDSIATASRHYDGTGWLMPVHASHPVAPPYALLDSQGDVLQYVTPAPGLNMYRYVKQKVGIYGQRSYMPSLKKPHVVAERVIDLDRHFR